MESFEEKIRQKGKSFDLYEPEKDHLARFILKLEKDQARHLHRHTPWYYTRAAAAVLILVAASYFVFDQFNNRPAQSPGMEITYAAELSEVMNYYDDLSREQLTEMEARTAGNDDAAKLKQVAYGRMEDIDSKLAEIEKEYMKNPDNEMLKAALINNRRKKAEIMQNILLKIDFANSQLY